MRDFHFNKTKLNSKGFSLLELVIVLIVSSLILGACLAIYREFMRGHSRQSRAMLAERSLRATELALRESLSTLPGKGFGVSNGASYSIPQLPFAGSIYDGSTNKFIRLGIITPYKINGEDAFTLTYSDANTPRLPIESISSQVGNIRTFRVALPNVGNNQSGSGTGKDEGLPTDDPKLGFPSSSSNSANNSTLPVIPSAEMFRAGQLMLVLEAPTFTDISTQPKQSVAVLVKLISVTQVNTANRQFLQFNCEICSQGGGCGQLINDPTANISNPAGAILAPLKLTSFYVKKDNFGNKLIRNDDGVILPSGDGFAVSGGKESIVGETDNFVVSYHLRDGSVVPTPNTPLVSWLNDVLSVDVSVSGAMAGSQGDDYFDRSAKLSFPIITRNLE